MKQTRYFLPALAGILMCSANAGQVKSIDAPECPKSGKVTAICGIGGTEDLDLLPDGRRLLASMGLSSDLHESAGAGGRLVVIDPDSGTHSDLSITNEYQPGWGDDACREPLSVMVPHGINIVKRSDDKWELLVVNHAGRESIEIFELTDKDASYTATWRGCVVNPDNGLLNDVAGAKDGSFVATIMMEKSSMPTPGNDHGIFSGKDTGWLVRWTLESGLQRLPNSEAPFNNGVEFGKDAKLVYFAAWTGKQLRTYSLADQKLVGTVDLDFYPDNITSRDDGKLVIAGMDEIASASACLQVATNFCMTPITVAAVDPVSGDQETLFHADAGVISAASVALQTAERLYVGSFHGDRLLKVNLEASE